MDFRPTREQELFRRALREYCERNIAPRSREIDEKAAGIPQELIKGLANLGVFGVTIPREYGGSAKPGEEMQYAILAIHEIARAELSMSLPVYTLLCIGWGYLLRLRAKEEVKREVLPKIASGDWFLGIAVTEPGGGSDVSQIRTRAVKAGDKYVVNGEKMFISGVEEAKQKGGGHLSLFITDPEKGHRGMTFFYVPTNLPGISTTTLQDMGRMGLSTGGLRYKDVEVPEKYVLGEENRGFHATMEGFNVARIVVAAACLGGAERCLEIGAEYSKQRIAFGRPIAKFEGISFEIAEDYTRLEMLKLLLQKAAWMIDQHYLNGSFTHRDLSLIVAQCKLKAPQLAVEIAQHAMMQLGALGYSKDSPLEMALRGFMSYVVGAEGTPNIMKLIIVREYLGDQYMATR